MTADAAATPAPPEGRYGRTPTERGRRATRAAVVVLAVLGLAVVVWLGVGQARTPVRWDEVGFRVDGPTATELTFDVTKDPDATAVCRVRALSERYAYRQGPPLEVPVHVLLGDGDEHVDPERAAGWARECVTEPRWHVFPGGHFFLTDHLPEIIDLMRHIVVSHTPVAE